MEWKSNSYLFTKTKKEWISLYTHTHTSLHCPPFPFSNQMWNLSNLWTEWKNQNQNQIKRNWAVGIVELSSSAANNQQRQQTNKKLLILCSKFKLEIWTTKMDYVQYGFVLKKSIKSKKCVCLWTDASILCTIEFSISWDLRPRPFVSLSNSNGIRKKINVLFPVCVRVCVTTIKT